MYSCTIKVDDTDEPVLEFHKILQKSIELDEISYKSYNFKRYIVYIFHMYFWATAAYVGD